MTIKIQKLTLIWYRDLIHRPHVTLSTYPNNVHFSKMTQSRVSHCTQFSYLISLFQSRILQIFLDFYDLDHFEDSRPVLQNAPCFIIPYDQTHYGFSGGTPRKSSCHCILSGGILFQFFSLTGDVNWYLPDCSPFSLCNS